MCWRGIGQSLLSIIWRLLGGTRLWLGSRGDGFGGQMPSGTLPGGDGGAFQPGLEAIEGHGSFAAIPPPVNPLQAQTAFERRARAEDYVAHAIAVIMTGGFFMLAFAALLGFVDISNAAEATFLGTT